MMGGRRQDDENRADGVDPWAPGGSMASVPLQTDADVQLSFDSVEQPAATPARTNRRSWLIGAAIVLAAAVGLAVAFSGTDDDSEADGDADSATIPETPPTSELDVNTPLLVADDPVADGALVSPTLRLTLAAAPREFVVDIAPELADINRTEVIGLQSEDGMYEVSIPSGRVRVTDLGFFSDQTQLVANDQAAVVWPTPEGLAQIIGTDGSIGVPTGAVDRVTWSPSVQTMYLWTSRSFDNGDEPEVRSLDFSGDMLGWKTLDWIDDPDDVATLLDFDGDLLRTDTGGTYAVGPDGAERITTGDIIANGPNHLLVRECDATRSCSIVSLGIDGTRTLWAGAIPDGVVPQQLAGLSPGGDALLVIGERLSADVPSELQILELADGSLQPLQASPIYEGFAAWDTTGAGVLYADTQLLYFDRFTGESVVVSEDLPRLHSIMARRPIATPICELLAIALPRFDEMAEGGTTNDVAPPAPDVLDRIVAFAPDDVVDGAIALTDFVNGFVSSEVADSQVVANWPADVTDGLAALDDYAATECAPL